MALLVSGGRGNMRPWGAAWSTVAKLKKKKSFSLPMTVLQTKAKETQATKCFIISSNNQYGLRTYYVELALEWHL